jgi:F-box/leucine-rich repeat protein 10/11
MKRWARYFSTPAEERKKTLNVISMEFSHTPLRKCIAAPDFVQNVDWVCNYW